MDDLNAMRWRRLSDSRFGIVLTIAHVLFLFGLLAGWIVPIFGAIFWASVAVTSIVAVQKDARKNCPRCGLNFRYKLWFGFPTEGREPTKCANCGLRALSQADFRRAAVNEKLDTQKPESGE
jgi:hypothetical protein